MVRLTTWKATLLYTPFFHLNIGPAKVNLNHLSSSPSLPQTITTTTTMQIIECVRVCMHGGTHPNPYRDQEEMN